MNETGLLASLGINGKLFLAQLINFGVLLFVVSRFILKPLMKNMEARETVIKTGVEQAEKAKKILADAEEKAANLIKQAKNERKELLEKLKVEAEDEKKKLQQETQAALEQQLNEARSRLASEKQAMLTSVKKEVADLVVLATKKVTTQVGQESPQQQAWIDEALQSLESEHV